MLLFLSFYDTRCPYPQQMNEALSDPSLSQHLKCCLKENTPVATKGSWLEGHFICTLGSLNIIHTCKNTHYRSFLLPR